MCFSAGASFGAAAVLSLAGAGAVAGAQTKAQRLFAAIPFIFSLQQVMEGMLWLAQKNEEIRIAEPFFLYAFLIFALVFWPAYIPFTIWLLEKENKRKKILRGLMLIGSAVSFCLTVALFLYPVNAIITHGHIHFSFDFPPVAENWVWLISLLYFMATIAAPFFSGIKRMKWFGIGFLAAYIFSVIFFRNYLVSVWCYFAATLSLVIIWILWDLQKEPKDLSIVV